MMYKIIGLTVSVLIVISLLVTGACTTRSIEVTGILQDSGSDGELSVLTPDGTLIKAKSDFSTVYENNGVRCSPADLPPGSVVSLRVQGDQAISVREVADIDEDEGEDGGGSTPTPTSSQDGALLYANYCAGCHNSSPPGSWRTNRTASQLTSDINSGPGSMPAYSGVLTTAQIAAIVQYIQGVSPSPSPTPTATTPVVDAAQIYANNCARCHGANRTGGSGPDITPSALSNRSLTNLISFISGHNTGASLSAAQVSALAGWLKGVTPVPTPTPTPTTPPTTTPPVCPPVDPHQNITWQGPNTCLICHQPQAEEMFSAVHYQWKGETPAIINGPDIQGKDVGAFNAFCINITGNWNGCGSCHVGQGARPEAIVSSAQLANIDCLVCHQQQYKRVKSGGAFVPDTANMTISMDQAVKTVHIPVRANCVQCHARSGGGDAFKRGDLTLAHASTADRNFDVHMSTTGGNLQCVNCHNWQDHRVPGRGADLRPSDLPFVPQCVDCHADKATSTGHTTAAINRHIDKLACQTCHVPEHGKNAADTAATEATEIHRTWQQSQSSGITYGPVITLANDVIPVYRFWNKTTSAYNLNDTAAVSQDTGEYGITRPLGNINDPNSKLYPFKYKTAEQPIATLLQKLIALDTSVFFRTGDSQQAIRSGLTNMGLSPDEPYSWVTTDEFLMLDHEVTPAAGALTCNDCHDTTTRIDLQGLGYVLKGPQSSVCSQCHDNENPPGYVQIHDTHRSEGIACASCHNFTRAPAPTPAPTPTPTGTPVANGSQLYASYCAGCHNASPPSSWRTNRTASQLTSSINSGPGSMPAYSGILTSAQISAIVQYIQGTAPSPAPTPTPTSTPTGTPVANGAQLYTSYCADCHNTTPPSSWRTSRTASQLTNDINSGPGSMPAFSGTLTAAQVSAIVQYIQGIVPSPTPTPTPTATATPVVDAAQIYANNCARCHGANRTGGSGPNITQSSLSNRSVSNLTNFISGHNTGSSLPAADVSALAAWLKSTP